MSELKFTSVCPIFQVSNLDRGIDFYTRVLGFDLAWKWGEPPDRASLCRDAVEIAIEVERLPLRSHAYIQVTGIDEYFARVTAAGAKVLNPLADRVYGMRDGRIADPDGNHLSLGEAIEGRGQT
jgi:predicted enzyme related to lactoylglutathione lyase